MNSKSDKAMSTAEFYKKLSKEDKSAIVDLSTERPIKMISSGSWVINQIIGDGSSQSKPGGFPRGHVVELFGDESAGKTTLGICACKQAQDIGEIPVWLDFERTFHKTYAKNLGLNLSPDKFILMEPDHFQHGARLIKDALLMRPALIVVDSVSAMTPRQVLEGDIDEAGRIGLQAQLMSMFLGYITKDLQPAETCLMFLNQLRAVIKKSKYEGGPDEESSGGNALRYYSSVRLKLKTGTVEKINAKSTITGKDEKKAVNVTVKVTAIKNKIDVPWKSGPMFIRFAEGIDNIQSLIELAVNRNIIKKSGAFFKFSIGDELVFSAQGNEQLREMLKNDNAMFNKLLKNITLKEDIEEKEESKEDVPDSLDTALENVATVYVEKVARKKKAKEEESND